MKIKKHAMTKSKLRTMVMVSLMAAIICALGPLSIPIGIVPISLTNLAIYVIVYIVGWKEGTVSYMLYLLIGLVGLPVFSGFSGGAGKLFGPTGGYLFGFIFMVVITGLCCDLCDRKIYMYIAGMIVGTAVTYFFGTLWLSYQSGMTFKEALAVGVIPFLIGDAIKIALSAVFAPLIRKQLIKANLIY